MRVIRLKTRKLIGTVLLLGCLLLLLFYTCSYLNIPHTFIWEYVSTQTENKTQAEKLLTFAAAEKKYGLLFDSLQEAEINDLTKRYNHDINLYWNKSGYLHGLKPKTRPLFDTSCSHNRTQHNEESVSIVICHKNELVYSFFRVLASIQEYTPSGILKEVLIIDDGSDIDNSEEIKEFGQALGIPIYSSRNNKSVGIAHCRYTGIRSATSEIIVILDSHIEVSETWLEPLLHILESKPRSLAVPLVDMLNENWYPGFIQYPIKPYIYEFTFGYTLLHWGEGGPPELDRGQPFPSPSLGGGAIVAYKSTLVDFYPKGVTEEYLWGIENNRLALRAWLCGDGIWISGCSQVTHLSGPDLALDRYGGFFTMKNKLERENLAEIINFLEHDSEKSNLLDRTYFNDMHYQEIYGMATKISKDFDHRKLCTKSYTWYLENIHTSIHYKYFESPEFLHVGEIQSQGSHHCLYCFMLGKDGVFLEPSCRKENTVFWDTHLFGFGVNGAVYTSNPDMLCWDVGKEGEGVRISQYPCHSRVPTGIVSDSQKFVYDEKTLQIRHPSSGRCVEMVKIESKAQVLLMNCGLTSLQKWVINRPKWALKLAI